MPGFWHGSGMERVFTESEANALIRELLGPVTVRAGTNTLLGLDPERIAEIPSLLEAATQQAEPPPKWDGRAAERVAETVAGFLG